MKTDKPVVPLTDTVAHSAQRFGLSEWTIRDLIRRGEIEARRHGTRVLVIQHSLIDYINRLPSAQGGAS